MIAIDAKDIQGYLQECKSNRENSMQRSWQGKYANRYKYQRKTGEGYIRNSEILKHYANAAYKIYIDLTSFIFT